MTDPDLQRLTELWQTPEPAAAEDFERLARRARRDARLMGWVDAALAFLVIAPMVVTSFIKPSIGVAIGAMLSIGMVVWLTMKRRALRQMAKTIAAEGRSNFLETSIRLAETTVRRDMIGAISFPPAILGALLARVAFRSETADPLGALSTWASTPRGLLALSLILGLVFWMVRNLRRHRAELRRLREVRVAYLQESEQDDAG